MSVLLPSPLSPAEAAHFGGCHRERCEWCDDLQAKIRAQAVERELDALLVAVAQDRARIVGAP